MESTMSRRVRRKARRSNIHLFILEAILLIVLVIEGFKFIRFILREPNSPTGYSESVSPK